MALSDNELIYEFNHGNKHAFTELIERYQHKVYNSTYRMLGNHEDALDMAQESFIRVYKNLNKFQVKSSFSTWLFRITTNICRDELRKRQRRLKTYDLEENKDEENIRQNLEDTGDPEKVFIKNELSETIQKKVDQLPPEQKIVFVLREFEGFSYSEITDILEISCGTVKSRLSRARRFLRDDLNKIYKNGGLI